MATAGDDGNGRQRQPGSRSPRFIPAHGGYEDLLTFRKARTIYDETVRFCSRFVDIRSRTHDQMVQAARFGKQNILEGSQASGTSRETEIKLTSVARASLEELLEDYRDYLRVNNAAPWDRNSEEALFVRKLGAREGVDYEAFREFFDTRPAEVVPMAECCWVRGGRWDKWDPWDLCAERFQTRVSPEHRQLTTENRKPKTDNRKPYVSCVAFVP